jgi:hypothetical protein
MMNRNKDLMTPLERERIKERERELMKKVWLWIDKKQTHIWFHILWTVLGIHLVIRNFFLWHEGRTKNSKSRKVIELLTGTIIIPSTASQRAEFINTLAMRPKQKMSQWKKMLDVLCGDDKQLGPHKPLFMIWQVLCQDES